MIRPYVYFYYSVRRSRSVTFGDPLADSRTSQKITHFDLSNNSIRDFRWLFADGDTPLLNKFKFLEKVDLSSNQLKFIPDALFRVNFLQLVRVFFSIYR